MAGTPNSCTAGRPGTEHDARTEVTLEILTRQGAAAAAAMTYAALIDRHIFGSALQAVEERATEERYGVTTRMSWPTPSRPFATWRAASGSYPILSDWMSHPHIASPTEQFELSLASCSTASPPGYPGGADRTTP